MIDKLVLERFQWELDGSDEAQFAQPGIDKQGSFFKETGIPMTLTELDISDENFRKMAEHADKVNYSKNAFVPLTVEDIVEIYKAYL